MANSDLNPKENTESDLSKRNRASSLKHRRQLGPAKEHRVLFARTRSFPECNGPDEVVEETDEGVPDAKEDINYNFCRVRSFKNTRKGLVRAGETFKPKDGVGTFKRAGSVRCYRKSVGRSESEDSTDSCHTTDSVGGSSLAESYYRVSVLGAAGVGKTTLLNRFLASDEQGDKENIEEGDETTVKRKKTVSVLLDGEESLLEFLDNYDGEDPPLNPEATSSENHVDSPSRHPNSDVIPFQCDAYAVVFALNDVTTLQEGRTTLCHLREDLGIDRAIFLVGNKSDLARQRHVTCEDACKLAHKYDCKYIETSAELGHRTDDLLVGILRHIRLKLSTSPGSENDVTEEEKTAAKKRHMWKKLSKLYKILHKSQHDVNSCSDVFL